jgi:hypothetical protein
LTSGLLSSPLIPLIGMVMKGMVNPSSTYNTHSKLRMNEVTVFLRNSVRVTRNLLYCHDKIMSCFNSRDVKFSQEG